MLIQCIAGRAVLASGPGGDRQHDRPALCPGGSNISASCGLKTLPPRCDFPPFTAPVSRPCPGRQVAGSHPGCASHQGRQWQRQPGVHAAPQGLPCGTQLAATWLPGSRAGLGGPLRPRSCAVAGSSSGHVPRRSWWPLRAQTAASL